MRSALMTLVGAALLAGCTTAPLMSRAPVEVGEGQLHRFWVPAKRESRVNIPAEAQKKNIPGVVVVQYLIDSKGRVIRPGVVSAEPPGVYNEAALSLIRGQRFEPAPDNPDRVPVTTKTEITFNQPGGY